MVSLSGAFIIFAEILLVIALLCSWTCFGYNQLVTSEFEESPDTQYEILSIAIASSFAFMVIILPMFSLGNVEMLSGILSMIILYASVVLIVAGSFIIHKIYPFINELTRNEKFSLACGIGAIIFGVLLLCGSIYVLVDLSKVLKNDKESSLRKKAEKLSNVRKQQIQQRAQQRSQEHIPVKQPISVMKKEESKPKTTVFEIDTVSKPKTVFFELETVNKLKPVPSESIQESIDLVTLSPCMSPVRINEPEKPSICKSLRRLSALNGSSDLSQLDVEIIAK